LQIYAELLRAEAEVSLAVPPGILEAIPRHLDRLVGRPLDYANSLNIIARTFTNYDGKLTTRTIVVSFLWFPWAIEVAHRWLARLERFGGAAEDQVRARRALGHLVVDLGAQGFAAAVDGAPTFVASETLYALAGITEQNPRATGTAAR
jgi:hypothetical protein